MVFSSLFFLYVFLPLNLLFYHLMPSMRAKNTVMMIFSLIFYAWGEPVYVFLLLAMAFADWILALYISAQPVRSAAAKRGWCSHVLVNLGLLGIFKYGTFFFWRIRIICSAFPDSVVQIALPIGISFYTFQLLSYVVDVYRGEVRAQRSFPTLLLYVSLFHQCIAGPIVRYKDINAELLQRKASRADISYGVTRYGGAGEKGGAGQCLRCWPISFGGGFCRHGRSASHDCSTAGAGPVGGRICLYAADLS